MKNSLHKAGAGKQFVHARSMRKEQTGAEAVLWQLLHNRRLLGYKFRRQHPVSSYIADFYCHELKLVIEVDGGYHNNEAQQIPDAERDRMLSASGIHTLRITNETLLHAPEQTMQYLVNEITRLSSVP